MYINKNTHLFVAAIKPEKLVLFCLVLLLSSWLMSDHLFCLISIIIIILFLINKLIYKKRLSFKFCYCHEVIDLNYILPASPNLLNIISTWTVLLPPVVVGRHSSFLPADARCRLVSPTLPDSKQFVLMVLTHGVEW